MEILAKSNPQETLQKHINDALLVANILKESFTNISPIIQEKTFWKSLKLSIIFHDLGKSHKEFQKKLLGNNNNWAGQRHELFSLPFVKALKYDKSDWVYYVVAGHHKNYEKLIEKLNEYEFDEYDELDLSGISEILTFEKAFEQNIPTKKVIEILNHYKIEISKPTLHNPKQELNKFIRKKIKNKTEIINLLLLIGAFKHCDHLSSAGIKNIAKLEARDFDFLHKAKFSLYIHQKKSAKTLGNAILTAPTGSGKTESALLWIQNQLNTWGKGHVFYILPFTASINAMYERINKNIPNKVGLVHGKVMSFIENKFQDDDLIDEMEIKKIKEHFKNLTTPFKVTTPFQLIKNLFAIKGYEKGIFEWAGGYFIFDEIHAYNPSVFAQIIVLLQFAIQYLNVKVFIMTATLPEFLRKEIENIIGDFAIIKSDNNLYEKFKRHRVILKKGKLSDNILLIQNAIDNNKRVLVVCNTVKQAQHVYKSLHSDNKVLLHSSFNAFDRNKKEKIVLDPKTNLLVGTQAIEVSLDIDYDIIFTEPAPLDALIQRFGRINRKRSKGISDCIVFEERNEADKFIYKNQEIINRTIHVLKENTLHNSGEINEANLQEMMNHVYPDWDKADKEEFDTIYHLLKNFIENDFKPFMDSKYGEEYFYKQFDGIKVLPVKFLPKYQKFLEENKFLKAENLKVQIREKRYHILNHENKIEIERTVFESIKSRKILENKTLIIYKKYDSELGLLIDEDETGSQGEDIFI